MKFSDSLQNLMQYRGPIGALWGKKFQLDSQRFGRYRFPGVGQFFDSRTVSFMLSKSCLTLNSVYFSTFIDLKTLKTFKSASLLFH